MPLNLPVPVLWTLAGIYGGLGLSTLIIFGMVWRDRQKDYTELKDRIRSWWIMVVVFSLALILKAPFSILFFAWLSFLALREYLSLIPTRPADHRVLFWAYLALIFIPVYMFLALPMRMVLIGETAGFLNAIGTLHWGLMLTVFTLSHLSYLRILPAAANSPIDGTGLLIYLVLLTEVNDIAQYIVGKGLGRHKVIPKVSPNKTVEGLLGGVMVTTGLAIALSPYLTPFDFPHALAVGLLLSLTGFIGDVTISALKRDLGIKDTGTLLPGHGGILDRIDSLTYTAPLFFHFTVYFYYRGQWP
jgi:phosphatidate cytidylyltransferase